MKADSLKISKVFSSGGDVHYYMPYFQREYAWEKKNWRTLLNDVMGLYDIYDPDNVPEHFMGALVVINDGTRNGVIPAFKLVDGQQRLTTISLVLCALGNLIKADHPEIHKRIRKLLANQDETGDIYFKILPTKKYGDQAVYLALISGEELPAKHDSKIPEVYQYFRKEFKTRYAAGTLDPERLFLVLVNSLQVVFIDLDQNERPYEIFESLNAKGKPLSQADLVRNYIAMKLPENRQREIFEKHWSQIEERLQEKRTVGRSRLGELTAFLRHYLAFRNGKLPNVSHVYERFRDRIEQDFPSVASFEKEIATLNQFAGYYDRLLRPENEPVIEIRARLERLSTLEISTAYPFLLVLYEQYDRETITENEFIQGLAILENYIVRRYLAGEPTNYLNKMFPTLWREISPAQFAVTLRKVIVIKNYPSDHRLRQVLPDAQLYDKRSDTRRKIVLVLESINRHLSTLDNSGGYTILDDAATIEHLMPQTLSAEWKKELGSNWDRVYDDYLNTIGNLTLVTQEWNSSLSNAPFAKKKQKLSTHALLLNNQYFNQRISRWDKAAIQERCGFLVDAILKIWPELGTPPVTDKAVRTKPRMLTILGEVYAVESWRDVAYQTALCLSELVNDFDKTVAEQLPSYFHREKFQSACRQLPNGWWIYMNLSAYSVKNLCRNMIEAVGLSDEDWEIEENEVR